MTAQPKQPKRPPIEWIVNLPSHDPYGKVSFRAACRGNADLGDMLNYFVYAASYEVKHNCPDTSTGFITVARTLDEIIDYLEISKKTATAYIRKLAEWSFLVPHSYHHTYDVNFQKVNEAISNPPEADKPKPRGKFAKREDGKSTIPTISEEDSKDSTDSRDSLREEIVNLSSEMVDLRSQIVNLSSIIVNLLSLPSFKDTPQEDLEPILASLKNLDNKKERERDSFGETFDNVCAQQDEFSDSHRIQETQGALNGHIPTSPTHRTGDLRDSHDDSGSNSVSQSESVGGAARAVEQGAPNEKDDILGRNRAAHTGQAAMESDEADGVLSSGFPLEQGLDQDRVSWEPMAMGNPATDTLEEDPDATVKMGAIRPSKQEESEDTRHVHTDTPGDPGLNGSRIPEPVRSGREHTNHAAQAETIDVAQYAPAFPSNSQQGGHSSHEGAASQGSASTVPTNPPGSPQEHGTPAEAQYMNIDEWEESQRTFLGRLRIYWDSLPRQDKVRLGGRWDGYRKGALDAWKKQHPKPKPVGCTPVMPPEDAPWNTNTVKALFDYWREKPLATTYQQGEASKIAQTLSLNYTRQQVVDVRTYMHDEDPWWKEHQEHIDIFSVGKHIHIKLQEMAKNKPQSNGHNTSHGNIIAHPTVSGRRRLDVFDDDDVPTSRAVYEQHAVYAQ